MHLIKTEREKHEWKENFYESKIAVDCVCKVQLKDVWMKIYNFMILYL